MEKKRVVVCGSTGNQGGAVVRSLAAGKQWEVVALSRQPAGAAAARLQEAGVLVARGDLSDQGSLLTAFQGASGVFGVTQPWSPDYKKCDVVAEVKQGQNIIDACLKTGVKHLVLSTVFLFDNQKMGVPHVDSKVDIERYARESKVPLTVIRPGSFMDNIGLPFFPVKRGSVQGFVGAEAKLPYVACSDIGALASIAFERPDEFLGKELNAIGDLRSGLELADTLSKLRGGERFRYKAPPAFLMWLFAREFYTMRREFERCGTPPVHPAILQALEATKHVYPNRTTLEAFLQRSGFATKVLA